MRAEAVKRGDTIAVWFSCGAASAVAARRTILEYSDIATVRVINNPVREEHPDNMRFLKDVEKWLGVEIEFATNDAYPNHSCAEVWDARSYMSGVHGAPCTQELKKQARYQWEAKNKADWHVLGFTADEEKRFDNFVMTERSNVLPVLIQKGITKKDCFRILRRAGVRRPAMYDLGYPNANCIGCVKASSPTYWNHVRRVHPDVFKERQEKSRELGARLVRVRGERIFLDELDPREKGRPMAAEQIECGIFCEEKVPEGKVLT